MSQGRRVDLHSGRPRRWAQGWGLALRMARRDLRRDRVRSVFVWAMIAIPVAAICGAHVVIASGDLSGAERVALRVGGGQAALTQLGYGFDPGFDGSGTALGGAGDSVRPATPVPGWGDGVAQQQDAVAALAGQPALAVTLSDPSRADGVMLLSLGVDTSRAEAAGVVQPTSGRLPAAPGEALVTPAGLAAGLPAAGAVSLVGADGASSEVVVVGVGRTRLDAVVDLVMAPDPAATTRYFLLTGDKPVTWQDAERFAGFGFETTSRYLAANPPDWVYEPGAEASGRFFASALISSGALLEVVLVVGPAFAIGAARQRRSLALAASNGATVAQLRRTALGQAILLGVTAAVAGGVVGTAAGIAVWPVLSADPLDVVGPLEVPGPQLAVAVGLGIAAALTAALVAARGLGRLDVVSALRGSVRPGPPRRGAPLAGGLLVAAGLAMCWSVGSLLELDSVWVFVAWCSGALAVVGGGLLLVPAALLAAARAVGGAPAAIRMAVRETSRQHGRATSTVAAITAGGVLLGVVWTMIGSIDADSARTYRPLAPSGQAWVVGNHADARAALDGAAAVIAAIEPALVTGRLADVTGWSAQGSAETQVTIAALRPGCRAADLYEVDAYPECLALRSDWSARRGGIVSGPVADLTRLFGLDGAQQQALREGKLLVDTGGADEPRSDWASAVTPITDGFVTFARLDHLEPGTEPATEQVPAVELASEVIARGASLDWTGALISSEAAAERDWVMNDWELRVAAPDTGIDAALEARLADALRPIGFSIEVERGWQPRPQPVVWAITGTLALLAVVAAAMATVLGVAELRPLLGTMAAVGADPRLSRRVAAIESWLLGFVGSALGALVGVGIGAPLALASTSHDRSTEPVLALPWPMLAALVVVVPLVASMVATCCVPSRPVLAHRGT